MSFRILVRDHLSPRWMGGISLVGFICMGPSLVPDSPALFGEITGENRINIMEGKVVRLDNILEFFNKGVRISSVGPQSLFYLREII